MDTEEIKIVFVTDKAYFSPMLATISSICSNTHSQLNIKVFTTFDIGKEERSHENYLQNKFKNMSLTFIKFNNDSIDRIQAKNHVSKAAFIKVMLPQLLEDWTKCIYLDGDLLFLENIKQLWEQFDTTKTISAVRTANYYQDNDILGLGPEEATFNSGVMLLNLDSMRRNNSVEKLLDFLYNYNDKTLLNDQAAFNKVFKNDWKKLDIKWNVYVQNFLFGPKQLKVSKKELVQSRITPYVIHFNGASKPWQKLCAHPYKEKYLFYYKQLFGSTSLLKGNTTKISYLKEKYSFFKGFVKLYIQ